MNSELRLFQHIIDINMNKARIRMLLFNMLDPDPRAFKEAGRGLLCHVKDSKCLAYSINRILEDKLLREKLVNKTYNDVKEHYSLEQNINKYVRIFNSFMQ